MNSRNYRFAFNNAIPTEFFNYSINQNFIETIITDENEAEYILYLPRIRKTRAQKLYITLINNENDENQENQVIYNHYYPDRRDHRGNLREFSGKTYNSNNTYQKWKSIIRELKTSINLHSNELSEENRNGIIDLYLNKHNITDPERIKLLKDYFEREYYNGSIEFIPIEEDNPLFNANEPEENFEPVFTIMNQYEFSVFLKKRFDNIEHTIERVMEENMSYLIDDDIEEFLN